MKFSSILSLIFTLYLYNYQPCIAQNSGEKFGDNVRYGGSFNLSFGNNYTTIGLSPSAIYDFDQQFSAGVSLSYLYANGKYYDPISNQNYNGTSNIVGGSLIALYSPIIGAQLSVEFEEMHVNYSDIYGNEKYWSPAIYLGAAYYSGNFSFGLRYDLLYTTNKSIYSSSITPVFRAYF